MARDKNGRNSDEVGLRSSKQRRESTRRMICVSRRVSRRARDTKDGGWGESCLRQPTRATGQQVNDCAPTGLHGLCFRACSV